MAVSIRLFDAENIDELGCGETEDGRYARSYLLPLLKYGSSHFIANVQTTCMALVIDEHIVLPVTLNQEEYSNSYVCSPYAHYVTYAQEELILLKQRWLRQMFSWLIRAFGVLCRACQINHAVHVNNWLLSTNLYPHLTSEQIKAIIDFLRARFPQHTIIFRSVNRYSNASLVDALRQAGCALIPSRQVYFVHPADPSSLRAKARWLLKRDFSLLARQGYTIVTADELTDEDLPRLVTLYNELYLEKYSTNNPMFTAEFLKLALTQKTLFLVALKKDGCLDAVLGYFCRNGVMTTPVFGYDTTLPKETGLYRMLSAVLFDIARQNKHLLHSSSGAAEFKRNRGAVASIEYSAVYHKHLSWRRRVCWFVLGSLLEKIGVPLLKKYKL